MTTYIDFENFERAVVVWIPAYAGMTRFYLAEWGR